MQGNENLPKLRCRHEGERMIQKIKEKSCKRKKCPYYTMYFRRCEFCEWNPKRMWAVRKKVQE